MHKKTILLSFYDCLCKMWLRKCKDYLYIESNRSLFYCITCTFVRRPKITKSIAQDLRTVM